MDTSYFKISQDTLTYLFQARKINKDLPALGPDLSTSNVRDFDQETLNKGNSIVGMQAGGFKGANQEGMTFGRPRAL